MNKEILLWLILMVFVILIYISYNFYNNKNMHPIVLMIYMLFYNILMALLMSKWMENYMYSIMLILIMVSGLLVMFLYFVSLISNEKMIISFDWFKLKFFMFWLMLIILLWMLLKMNFLESMNWGGLYSEIDVMMKLNNLMYNNIKMFYKYPWSNITVMCMMYLLMCLIVIVKMCSIKYSSLRKLV